MRVVSSRVFQVEMPSGERRGYFRTADEAERAIPDIQHDALFRICSGQNVRRGGKSWAICLNWPDHGPLHWRQHDKNGRVRRFREPEQAQAFADRLNADPVLANPPLRITIKTTEIAELALDRRTEA